MEELKKFQSSTFDTIARRRLVEDQDTILGLTGKIQELQNQINCVSDSKRSSRCWINSHWKFPRYQSTSVFPTWSNSWRNAKPFYRNAEPGRQAFGTRMVYRETFLQVQLRLLQHHIRTNWIHGVQAFQNRFTHHRRRRMIIKHQLKIRDASLDRQPKIQSSLVREILQRIMGQTNNDCRFQIFILTSSPHQQRLLVGR